MGDPIDGSPPGSSIHEIFQARVLEQGAIAFFESMFYFSIFPITCIVMLLHCCLACSSCHVPLSVGLPRQEYWSGLPFPSPGDLPSSGIRLRLLHCQVDSLLMSHEGRLTWPLNRHLLLKNIYVLGLLFFFSLRAMALYSNE